MTADLTAAAFRDGWNRAHRQRPASFPRMLSDNELAAWDDGWRNGQAARRRAAAVAARAAEDAVGTAVLECARIAVREYLRTHPRGAHRHDDLLADVVLTLSRAAAAYDPTRGVPLHAWLSIRGRGAVIDAVRERSPLTRGEHDRGLTVHDLPPYRLLALSTDELLEAGLDAADPDDFTNRIAGQQLVDQLLAACSDRERHLLVATLMHGHTVLDVARQWGCDQSWVVKVRKRCLARLRVQHNEAAA